MAKVPVPPEVHVIVVWLDALELAVIFTAPAFEQLLKLAPAMAVIGLLIVSVLVEVTFPQGVFPKAVKDNTTLPAVISAALGV